MPTLSASDYTTFLRFKAAAASPIRPDIQTRTNASLSQSVINANILASQAAFVTTPATTTIIASSVTVTAAGASVITGVEDVGSASIGYTTSQPHGLSVGDVVTIAGFSQDDFSTDPNGEKTVAGILSPTVFRVHVGSTTTGAASGTGRFVNRVYYTTNAAHGLVVGDVATVTGIPTFTASGARVALVPSTTTFVLTSSTTGTSETGASGSLTYPRYANQAMAVRGLARVQGQQVVQVRSNPNALSTLSFAGTSGAMSSSATTRPGGLPTGFKGSQGSYHRIPQNAGWIQGNMLSSGQKRF